MNSTPLSPFGSVIRYQKILIVGSDGTIGAALEKSLREDGYNVTGTTRRLNQISADCIYIDFEDASTFANLVLQSFDIAVLCCAVTSLKVCEENPVYTREINVKRLIDVANILACNGVRLIFLSSNLVFDGSKPNCLPCDDVNPVTEYGKQKAEVESWILSHQPASAIIRFGKVLYPQYQLFLQWRNQLMSGNLISPYANKTIAPISLATAIKILSWLIRSRTPGIFQATASSDITYAEIARYIAQWLNANPSLIVPVNVPSHPENDIKVTRENAYNTLQISPIFLELFGDLSPMDAIAYSILD